MDPSGNFGFPSLAAAWGTARNVSPESATFAPGGAPGNVSPSICCHKGGGGEAPATSVSTDRGGIRLRAHLPGRKLRIPEIRSWQFPTRRPGWESESRPKGRSVPLGGPPRGRPVVDSNKNFKNTPRLAWEYFSIILQYFWSTCGSASEIVRKVLPGDFARGAKSNQQIL